MPNYKALVGELYGAELTTGFPLKAYPSWRAALARAVVRTTAGGVLAREFFVVARPGEKL